MSFVRFRHRIIQSFWSVIEYLVFPLLLLAATPYFLEALGPRQYAKWMFVLTLTGLSGIAGLGMNTAVIRAISSSRGKGNLEQCVLSLEYALGISITATVGVAGLMLVGFYFFGSSYFNGIGAPEEILVLAILAISLIVTEQLDSIFAAALKGMERYDLVAKIEAIFRILGLLSGLIAAMLRGSVFDVILALLFFNIIRSFFKAGAALRIFGINQIRPKFSMRETHGLISVGVWAWGLAVGGALFSVADRIIISGEIGAQALTEYSICLQIAQQIQAIPAAALNWIYPATIFSIASNNPTRERLGQYFLVNIMLTGAILLPIAIFGDKLLMLMLNNNVSKEAYTTLLWLVIGIGTLSINISPHYLLMGFDRNRYLAIINIVAGVCCLMSSMIFVPSYGVIGAALARCVYGFIVCFNYIYLFRVTSRDA